MTDEEKIALVDKAFVSAAYKAGEAAERKRIVAVLERDPKLRFIAALIENSVAPFESRP